ncbi:ABC transporter permease [Bacillus velezensis]|nr:ABC transporter permease [Bacillus velezensis]
MYLYDVKNIWRQNKWQWIIWIFVIAFLLFMIVHSLNIININSVWESLMGNELFFMPFPYFFICGFYLLINGNYLYQQRSKTISIVLTRVSSRKQWLFGKLFFTIVMCTSYCLLLILLVHIAVFLKHGNFRYDHYTAYTFFTVFLTLLICGLFQTIYILKVKPIQAFFVVYGLLILPVWIDAPFLPGYYSFISNTLITPHEVNHSGYLFFFTIITICLIMLAIKQIRHKNFF